MPMIILILTEVIKNAVLMMDESSAAMWRESLGQQLKSSVFLRSM